MKQYELIPDYGTLFTAKEFKEACKEGSFIDYDGSGYYSDGKGYWWNKPVSCGRFVNDEEDTTFSHVMWFNR